MTTEKFCTRCGKKFLATGREVICPSCKQAAAEDAKRAAVLKAKRASWNGESVPVRISGRASTMIREWAKLHNMSFAESLDDLLQCVADDMEVAEMWATRSWVSWEDITPYKSRRRDKHATEDEQAAGKQDAPQAAGKQDTASKPQNVQTAQEVKTAAKTTGKTAGSKAATAVKKGGKKA